jgi:hypothetical protein
LRMLSLICGNLNPPPFSGSRYRLLSLLNSS